MIKRTESYELNKKFIHNTEYRYEASNVWRRFDAARSFCQDKGMDLPQMNPKLYSKEGRKLVISQNKNIFQQFAVA